MSDQNTVSNNSIASETLTQVTGDNVGDKAQVADEQQSQVVTQVESVYPEIYLADQDFELPEEGTYYVVAKNGIFLNKSSILGNALVKVDGISNSDLKDVNPTFQLALPEVPGRIIWQAWQFFREVFKQYRAESYVTLLYSKKLNQYMLWCPAQTVTGGSVQYNRADQPTLEERQKYGWKVVGTIHSHCDFSAFHSGVDTDDEADFDGLHITLGHVNRDAFSMVSSAAINANRIGYDPTEVAEVIQTGSENEEQPNKHWKVANRRDNFFVPVLEEGSEAEQEEDLKLIMDNWMPKVTSGWKGNGKKTKSGGSNSVGFQPYEWSDFDDSIWKQGGSRDEPVDKWWKDQP